MTTTQQAAETARLVDQILDVAPSDDAEARAEHLLESCATYTIALRALRQAMRNNGDADAAKLLDDALIKMAVWDAENT